MPLNERQYAAARAVHTTPLKIIAGAGTGKTETLAARYVELVRRGTAPERIVLLTFTEDAAAEMRARVMLRLREAAIDLAPHALLDLWIATFHGFASRLLHEQGFAVGLPPTPRLLSDDDQQEFWQALRETIEAQPQLANGYVPLDHAVYRWDNDETWNRVLHVVQALRRGGGTAADLQPHAQLATQQLSEFAAHRAQLVPLIEYCYAAYVDHLQRGGSLDYDEQLRIALRLLRAKPDLATRFDVLMVDEFQDTNRPQLDLLREAQPGFDRTTVVGDPRQAIYGWNSARAESIKQFPFRDAGAAGEAVSLTINYRSHPAIVKVANLALEGTELGREAQLENGPLREARHPALADEPVVSLHVLSSVAEEARYVAANIRRLHENGLAYHEMAILLRSRTKLPELLDALRAEGVPYVLNGGTGFYLHPLVRLTSSLLRLILNPLDHAAWAHILQSPLIGLPASSIAVHDRHASVLDRAPLPFTQWLDDPQRVPDDVPDRDLVVQRLHKFQQFYEAARLCWGLVLPGAYLEWLWQASGLSHTALADQDVQARLTLRQLLRDADEYAAAHATEGIAGFAALLQRRVLEQPRVALPTMPTSAAVEIATVHQAKGREWSVVFVYNTTLPGQKASQVERVLWDEQWNLVISEGSTSRTKKHDPLQDLRDDLRRRNRNEERSIWYVALTRAQERLFILHSGCLYTEGFADARAKLARLQNAEHLTREDEAVHFFHELWERLVVQSDQLDSTIACQSHSVNDDRSNGAAQ